jgi:group I intron endonuclease
MLITLEENLKQTGIYKIENPVNNEFYIGSASISFNKRFLNHRRLLHINKNPCKFLQHSYNKYKNIDFIFSILEICSKDKCIEKEQYFLDTLVPKYNICKTASSTLGLKFDESHLINHFESQRKFTDDEVILMFNLYNKNVKVKDIAKTLNCKPNNISSIINKPKKYIWVKNKYDLKIENKKTKYNGQFLIIDPHGNKIIVDNLTEYAKQNKLEASNLNRCSNNIIKSSKGYKIEKLNTIGN